MWFCKTLKYSGKVVGKYTIEEPIGEGRYGLCFLARSNMGEKVIIKKSSQLSLKEIQIRMNMKQLYFQI